MRKAGQADDAHDLAQETWLHVYLGLHRLREPSHFAAWLWAIARNVVQMWLRRHRRHAVWDKLDDDALDAAAPSPEETVAALDVRIAILEALAQLSPLNREAVRLHYLEGWSYCDIAVRLDVPVETVKSRLQKARRQLKPQLAGMIDVPLVEYAGKEELRMIEATIYDVYYVTNPEHEQPQTMVVLKAQTEERYLPIWVGQPEAEGIAVKLRSLTPKRPLTYDLMTQLVERLNGSIEAVQLSALREETFFATLRIVANGMTTELDCRPSDALALAIRTRTPIFIADDVLAQAGRDEPMAFFKPEDNNQGKAIMPLSG